MKLVIIFVVIAVVAVVFGVGAKIMFRIPKRAPDDWINDIFGFILAALSFIFAAIAVFGSLVQLFK